MVCFSETEDTPSFFLRIYSLRLDSWWDTWSIRDPTIRSSCPFWSAGYTCGEDCSCASEVIIISNCYLNIEILLESFWIASIQKIIALIQIFNQTMQRLKNQPKFTIFLWFRTILILQNLSVCWFSFSSRIISLRIWELSFARLSFFFPNFRFFRVPPYFLRLSNFSPEDKKLLLRGANVESSRSLIA